MAMTTKQIRLAQCRRLAWGSAPGLVDPDALYEAAEAAWSNLNPQSVSFDYALSVAFVAIRAYNQISGPTP